MTSFIIDDCELDSGELIEDIRHGISDVISEYSETYKPEVKITEDPIIKCGKWRLINLSGIDSNVPYVRYQDVQCTTCGQIESSVLYNRPYCPNCGAKMHIK